VRVDVARFQPLFVRCGQRLRQATILGHQEEARPRDRREDNRSVLTPVRASLARCIGEHDWRAAAQRDLLHLPVSEEPEPL
jgi:hypothetical protein